VLLVFVLEEELTQYSVGEVGIEFVEELKARNIPRCCFVCGRVGQYLLARHLKTISKRFYCLKQTSQK
jgi:hypothetical protein